MSYLEDTIDWQIARDLSNWLDDNVSEVYQNQPLAQNWARIAKVQEELGEAIAEFISWTGQNPRKPSDPDAKMKLMTELADTALTAIYAMVHFSERFPDGTSPRHILMERIKHHADRIGLYASSPDIG